jgi:hypothetical protein
MFRLYSFAIDMPSRRINWKHSQSCVLRSQIFPFCSCRQPDDGYTPKPKHVVLYSEVNIWLKSMTGINALKILTLNPLTWKIWWAPNKVSKWQMGFNSAFSVKQLCLDSKAMYLWFHLNLAKKWTCQTRGDAVSSGFNLLRLQVYETWFTVWVRSRSAHGHGNCFMYLKASVDNNGHADVTGQLPPALHWLCFVTCLEQGEQRSSAAREFCVTLILCLPWTYLELTVRVLDWS